MCQGRAVFRGKLQPVSTKTYMLRTAQPAGSPGQGSPGKLSPGPAAQEAVPGEEGMRTPGSWKP